MLLIDKIIWGLLIFCFLSGWINGFLRSLIGPIAFIGCFLSAVIFYDLNHNILMATIITFAGTIALAMSFSIILTAGFKALNKEYRGKVFLLSRIFGSITNLAWQGNILFILMILFSILPGHKGLMMQLQFEVPQSTMISYYKNKVVRHFPEYQALIASLECIRNPDELKDIVKSDRFQAFAAHPKVLALIHDPEYKSALAQKNVIKLLQVTTLQELVVNDSAMYQFTKVADMVYTDKLARYMAATDQRFSQ